jgi:hypothetical protein
MIAVDRNPFVVQRRIKEVLEPLFHAHMADAIMTAETSAPATWAQTFRLSGAARYDEWRGPITPSDNMAHEVYDLMRLLKGDPVRTFSQLDIGYDALLIPNGRGVTIEPLVLVFSERAGEEYRRALIDAGVVREYGYWNNTDGPEGISDREWNQREKAWGKLDVPASDGLAIAMPTRFETWRKVVRLPSW